jgi:ABC-type transporter Mla MlaB component
MPTEIAYIAEENRLDLTFNGNLDVSVTHDVFGLCKRVPPGLDACIIDLSNVVRLFDSGVALLRILYARLTDAGATIVILADRPEIRELIPAIARVSSLPMTERPNMTFVTAGSVRPSRAAF